jgi:hypothetical protein
MIATMITPGMSIQLLFRNLNTCAFRGGIGLSEGFRAVPMRRVTLLIARLLKWSAQDHSRSCLASP